MTRAAVADRATMVARELSLPPAAGPPAGYAFAFSASGRVPRSSTPAS